MSSALTSAGSQNFLGARWVVWLLHAAPSGWKPAVARWLLSLSPHYFYDKDRRAEADRNRDSRARLAGDLLAPHITAGMRVVDYGCGPGYLAVAAARLGATVEAVDVSTGVLECARVLNPHPDVTYETLAECAARTEPVDLVYTFAVVQHLTDETFAEALRLWRTRLREGGVLLMHFPTPVDEWRTESQWRQDTSLVNKVRLRWGMNCFGRDENTVRRMLIDAGFTDIRVESLAGKTDADPDIPRQKWAVATRGQSATARSIS